jgi:hypothetical protein
MTEMTNETTKPAPVLPDYCGWCSKELTTPKQHAYGYCSTECGTADAADYEATERDKWEYYHEA